MTEQPQGKTVRDTKPMPDVKPEPEKKPEQKVQIKIEPGNIPVLTIQMLDAINKNIVVLIDMLAEQIKKEKPDG